MKGAYFERSQMNSAIAQQDIVRDELHKTINATGIARPFHNPPFSGTFCSPLGIIHKKNPSEFRLIHHLRVSTVDISFNWSAALRRQVRAYIHADCVLQLHLVFVKL